MRITYLTHKMMEKVISSGGFRSLNIENKRQQLDENEESVSSESTAPVRTWVDGLCINYMTEKKKSMVVQVVYSLGATSALSESL